MKLLGAETYVLPKKLKISIPARRFLQTLDPVKERIAWHGALRGNPSGGNKLGVLYNHRPQINRAAYERDPEVRLDGVLEYGQRIEQPGLLL